MKTSAIPVLVRHRFIKQVIISNLKEEPKIKAIRNMNDLDAAMKPILKEMVDKMADRVYETLNYFLQNYYDGYEPTSYRRQYDFIRDCFKVCVNLKN